VDGANSLPIRAGEAAAAMLDRLNDQRFGAIVRVLRVRRRWRQVDLARRAGVSQSVVSRIERGHLDTLTLETIRRVLAALDARPDVVVRWRGGDLDRMLAAGHAALHEEVAAALLAEPGWRVLPEVSFSIWGERGVIDILAWHEPTRSLLVIELKTELVDFNELLGTLDRKSRLARQIAAERGWTNPSSVSVWVVVVDSSTSRRRAREHATMLRGALPDDGRTMRRWLGQPVGRVAALSFWPNIRRGTGKSGSRPIRPSTSRVRLGATHEERAPASRKSTYQSTGE
jgi:transcriptional regulator with XRE-family HTH domain